MSRPETPAAFEASITPSKPLAEFKAVTRDRQSVKDINLESSTVEGWFSAKWFKPTPGQIRDFSIFLMDIRCAKIRAQKCRKVGLPTRDRWEEAVQVLLDDLDEVIRGRVEFENEMMLPKGPEGRSSSALAKLLQAVRSFRLHYPSPPALSINASAVDEKNERAVAIYNRLNSMAREARGRSMAADSRNEKIMSVIVAAMDWCGWAVTAAGIAKNISDHGKDLHARRQKRAKKS